MSSKVRACLLTAGVLSLSFAQADTPRNWTDTKGRTISGSFVRQDDQTVWVRRSDGKDLAIPKNSLSDGDKVFLSTMTSVPSTGGGAAKPASPTGDFNSVKVDPTSFKPVAGGFKLDNIGFANAIETDHFIIAATEKVKPVITNAYGDAAERLWADLTKDLPAFSKGFEGNKFLIVLADGEGEAKIVDSWHEKHAQSARKSSSYISHPDLTQANIVGFNMSDSFAAEHHVCSFARMFRTDAKTAKNGNRTWEQRIHFLTADLLRQAQGGEKSSYSYRGDDDTSYNLIGFNLAFSYQREFAVCGRIETEVHFSGSGADVEGFKNGKGWALGTKKLIKGGAKPDLDGFLKLDVDKIAPRDLGMGYGLMQMIRKDPKKMAGLDDMITHLQNSKKNPTPAEFAKFLGYDSVDALNTAWLAFMESDAFI